MDFKEYQEKAGRTRNVRIGEHAEAINYGLGMVCEAGEVGDLLKKWAFHNHEFDRDEVIKEIGDTMWYMANLCTIFDISMEEVAQKNIDKLQKRYPQGFSADDSINRKEYVRENSKCFNGGIAFMAFSSLFGKEDYN